MAFGLYMLGRVRHLCGFCADARVLVMYVLKTGFTLVNIGCIKQKPGNSDYNFGRVANENVARHKTNQPSPPSLDPQNHMTLSLN